MKRINIETHMEDYPLLGIWEIGNARRGDGYEVPAELLDALRRAEKTVEDAQAAIMLHVARAYPEADDIRAWLRDRKLQP